MTAARAGGYSPAPHCTHQPTPGRVMDIERFEAISFYVGCGVLIGYMLFIIWRLARDSQAGKFGTIMLFVVLAVGMIGFIAKEAMVLFMGL